MEQNTYAQSTTLDNKIDIDEVSIIRGILRQWWVIALVTIGTYFLAYVYIDSQYVPQYTTSTTFIVSQRGAAYSAYTNNKNAIDTATKFTTILGSNVLQKKVAYELGLSSLNAKVSAEVIPETNLVVLKVTADSAHGSFQILQSMLKNHGLVSEYLLKNIMMDVVQPATIPTRPANSSNTSRSAMLAAVMACLLMMVFFGSLGMVRDTVKSGRELTKKLDAKLLGVIYHEKKHKTLKSKLQKKQINMLVNNPVLSARYVENYKLLAARVRNKMRRSDSKALLITSVMENEGKSTVAANIALCIAESGERVLLIDGDMRKPAQYKIFEIETEKAKAFGNVLSGKQMVTESIVQLGNTKVFGILNAEYQSQSTELIDNGLMPDILNQLKEEFDYIIIDSSPMALVADAEAMAKYADDSLLVVKEDFVRTKDLNDAIDILNMQKAKFIGCVLNSVHSEER